MGCALISVCWSFLLNLLFSLSGSIVFVDSNVSPVRFPLPFPWWRSRHFGSHQRLTFSAPNKPHLLFSFNTQASHFTWFSSYWFCTWLCTIVDRLWCTFTVICFELKMASGYIFVILISEIIKRWIRWMTEFEWFFPDFLCYVLIAMWHKLRRWCSESKSPILATWVRFPGGATNFWNFPRTIKHILFCVSKLKTRSFGKANPCILCKRQTANHDNAMFI